MHQYSYTYNSPDRTIYTAFSPHPDGANWVGVIIENGWMRAYARAKTAFGAVKRASEELKAMKEDLAK